jgi:hypothetical protein
LDHIALYVLLITGILNLAGIGGLFYKFSIMGYQHNLMWKVFARQHGLDGNSPRTNGRAPDPMEIIDGVKH